MEFAPTKYGTRFFVGVNGRSPLEARINSGLFSQHL